MCTGGTPTAPAPVPQRQAARAPDASSIAARTTDNAKRRLGMAASILTPQATGLGPAVTTKTLLGQ
jgi:hypothetical protein